MRKTRHFDQLDAAENAFFGPALEQVKARTYDRKYPNLRARQFIPLDPEIDPATQTMKIRSYSQVGMAKLLASYADDLPRADVKAEEMVVSFKGIGTSYGYGLDEVKAAAKAGYPLDAQKAAAARRATEVTIDRVLAEGDAATGLIGLLNQPNALTYAVPNGAGGTTEWSTKTPAEILADLVGICEYVNLQTAEVEQPDLIIMPRAQLVLLRTSRYDTNSDKTILEWFQSTYPGVAVESWARLQGAGAGGADRMVAYTRSPDHLQGAVPQEFEQLPVQERGLQFVIPCHARVGGVAVYYPLSMAYGDGI